MVELEPPYGTTRLTLFNFHKTLARGQKIFDSLIKSKRMIGGGSLCSQSPVTDFNNWERDVHNPSLVFPEVVGGDDNKLE